MDLNCRTPIQAKYNEPWAVGAEAEITVSVPAGVHWRASSEGMPMWGPNRSWPGSGLVVCCLGPGFTVLALDPE